MTEEDRARQKAIDEAYKAKMNKIPDQKASSDPWGDCAQSPMRQRARQRRGSPVRNRSMREIFTKIAMGRANDEDRTHGIQGRRDDTGRLCGLCSRPATSVPAFCCVRTGWPCRAFSNQARRTCWCRSATMCSSPTSTARASARRRMEACAAEMMQVPQRPPAAARPRAAPRSRCCKKLPNTDTVAPRRDRLLLRRHDGS